MKNIFSLAALSLAVGLVSTSCLGDDPEYSQELNMNYAGEACFNRVVDLETGESLVSGNPSYSMKFVNDGKKSSMTMEMSGIQLSSGFSGLAFKLPELGYSFNSDTDYFTSTGTDLKPLNAGDSYTFDKFSLRFIPTRNVDGLNCPVYLIDYTVNNRYQVTVFPTTPVLFATSTGRDEVTGDEYVNNDINAYVSAKIDPAKMTARVSLAKAQFGHGMITSNLIIKDLAVKLEGNSILISSPEDQTLTIYNTNNKPYNKSTVTNLSMRLDITAGVGVLTGDFVIDNPLGAEPGYMPEKYAVTINLNYFYKEAHEK